MKSIFTLISIILIFPSLLKAQVSQVDLDYYLPQDIEYNADIPSPKSVLGFEIGEWHLSHGQLLHYMRVIAEASDRITLHEYARSYEQRPLIYLSITSAQNQENIDRLQKEHVQLTDPSKSKELDTKNMPIVTRLSYSVHGNEASGANSSALVAYYLAAAQGKKIDDLLKNTIIILDPSINPDGMQRFSSWVNTHQSYQAVTDPSSREFNEAFPRGRTNHYWFDLNRDWLLLQHPESIGRVKNFHDWKPNILTDHHEMGSNSTFFFQPGVPSRTNPNTPSQNQALTAEIGTYHAKALDAIGSLYYSEEGYDDFYYGKGSTYPDINGGIGILFEQGSARGHSRETENGILNFSFAIRNQFTTSLSTLEAGLAMREKLLNYQRDFYASAPKESGAYVFGDSEDLMRNYHLAQILAQHQIQVYALDQDVQLDGESFEKNKAYVVPMDQDQVRLIKAVFEKVNTYQDSLFYDVSAWTLPLAFNLPYAKTGKIPAYQKDTNLSQAEGELNGGLSTVGYLFDWDDYYAPRVLHKILDRGLRAKVATREASIENGDQSIQVKYGTIFVPSTQQKLSPSEIQAFLKTLAQENHLEIKASPTGLSEGGIDLGSNDMENLQHPRPLLVIGDGVRSYDAGEVWHLLDQRYHMPLTMVEQSDMNRVDLSKYRTLIMVSGNYNALSSLGKVKDWIRAGNTLICLGTANRWAAQQSLASIDFKKLPPIDSSVQYTYADRSNLRGAQALGGSIFEARLDITHPLGYGFRKSAIPVFKNNRLFLEESKQAFSVPLRYTETPRLSGYISSPNLELLKSSPAIVVTHYGRGQVISMVDNPNFRAFWYGTNKLFANALFFGSIIQP